MGKLIKEVGEKTPDHKNDKNNNKDGVFMSYIKDNPIPTLAFFFTLTMAIIGAVSTYAVLKDNVAEIGSKIKPIQEKQIEIDKKIIVMEQSNHIMQKTINAQVDMLTSLSKDNAQLRTDSIVMNNTVDNLNSTLDKVNNTLEKLDRVVSKVDLDMENIKEDIKEMQGK